MNCFDCIINNRPCLSLGIEKKFFQWHFFQVKLFFLFIQKKNFTFYAYMVIKFTEFYLHGHRKHKIMGVE